MFDKASLFLLYYKDQTTFLFLATARQTHTYTEFTVHSNFSRTSMDTDFGKIKKYRSELQNKYTNTNLYVGTETNRNTFHWLRVKETIKRKLHT